MREHKATNVEVVLYSYAIGFIYLLIILALSGTLLSSIRFCATVCSIFVCFYFFFIIFVKNSSRQFGLTKLLFFLIFQYPIETYGYAFLFSITGYLGIQFVLTLVRTCGATLAATVTTARKAVTIALSFVFFSKPFSFQ